MTAVRFCARCGAGLEDAASKNFGVGPVCRGKYNYVLAKEMFADIPRAREELMAGWEMFAFPDEALPMIEKVYTAVMGLDGAHSDDWRDVVSTIEWVLSFGDVAGQTRITLERVADALGYHSLVLMWRKEVVKGEASVRFDPQNGHILLKGPRAPRKVTKRIKSIPGHWFDRRSREWQFPWTELERVSRDIFPCYLALEGADEIERQVAEYKATAAAQFHRTSPRPASYTITRMGRGEIAFNVPYSAKFLKKFKEAIPWQDRQWNPGQKVWTVRGHKGTLMTLLHTHFGNYGVDPQQAWGRTHRSQR